MATETTYNGYIDLRDLNEEFEVLKEREADEDDELNEDELERLAALRELDNDLQDLASWAYNEPNAIAEPEFEEYAEELAYDIGMVERDSQIANYIDWEKWARDVKYDYTSFEFEGRTYLVRSF